MFFFIFLISLQYFIVAEDPEVKMTPVEIIKHWGYEGEDIKVTTDDGYILHMHRIPQGKYMKKGIKRPVVFLQHGVLSSSADWISNLPYQSAGFIFADAGFDVFMGNIRGNTYSTEHVSLDTKSSEYWNFSWDEMVKYDLDAMINKALEISGQDHLYYIGHSQGTLIMFSKLSLNTTLTKKIRQFHALAPIGTVGHLKGPLNSLAKLLNHQSLLLELLFENKNFMSNNWKVNKYVKFFCELPIIKKFCEDVFFVFTGPNSKQLNDSRLPVYLGHFPADTSIKNMIHYIQMVNSDKQQMFDYEWSFLNMQHYGQSTPPVYDISNIDVDTFLYWGDDDYIADSKDILNYLVKKIKPSAFKANFEYENFNHLDFIWGLRAAPEVYKTILLNIMHDVRNNLPVYDVVNKEN